MFLSLGAREIMSEGFSCESPCVGSGRNFSDEAKRYFVTSRGQHLLFQMVGWLQANVSDLDREDAHAVRIDFGLRPFDEENPVRVIAKLKYASAVKAVSNLNNGDLQALYGVAAPDSDMVLISIEN